MYPVSVCKCEIYFVNGKYRPITLRVTVYMNFYEKHYRYILASLFRQSAQFTYSIHTKMYKYTYTYSSKQHVVIHRISLGLYLLHDSCIIHNNYAKLVIDRRSRNHKNHQVLPPSTCTHTAALEHIHTCTCIKSHGLQTSP